jgi:hypothetical protein
MYRTFRDMQNNAERSDEIRVFRKYPEVRWEKIWTNLHTAWISDNQRSTWYMVIHDFVPTNDRLAAIKLTETNRCRTCDDTDFVQHRLTQCGDSKLIWNWTRARIAAIMRTNSIDITEKCTTKPDLRIWSPQSHNAIVWMIAHLITYHTQGQRRKLLMDYMDYMRRARWKADPRTTRQKIVGNYLSILYPPS